VVAVALCVSSVQSPAQDKKGAVPASTAAFIKVSRALLRDLALLQLSDVPTLGSVAKCVPKPPRPDGLCPPLCPAPSSMRAMRKYTEGKSSYVAAAGQVGVLADNSWICDPNGIEKKLNDLVTRIDRIGNWVVTSDTGSVTILATAPAVNPGQKIPKLMPTAERTRGFAALDYLNGEFTEGRDPNIRQQ
jgi:hypothetical protein